MKNEVSWTSSNSGADHERAPPSCFGRGSVGQKWYAERHALSLTDAPTYVATSRVWDDNHQQRINEHRDRRDDRWHTIEEPLELAATLNP